MQRDVKEGLMRSYVPVAAVCVGMLLACAGPAGAQEDHLTFAQAASLADYPVYKPHRTVSLPVRVRTVANTCVAPAGGW
jgi:hypothetical protein